MSIANRNEKSQRVNVCALRSLLVVCQTSACVCVIISVQLRDAVT